MAAIPDNDIGPGDSAPPGDSSGQINPALQALSSGMQTGMGKAWTNIAVNRVQDYLTAKSVALDNQNAGDEFVQNINNVKTGLVTLAKADPGAIDVSLDLAQHTVNGIVDQHSHLDDDTRAGLASQLTDHLQTEIAHAGVQRLAEMDRDAANAAIDKYSSILPEDQQAALRTYANVQHNLRQQDTFAAQVQQQKDAALAGYHSASTYVNGLLDEHGDFAAPPGFMSNLVADPSLAPDTKLALRAGYQALQTYGDPHASDPHVVAGLIDRMASPDKPAQAEIMAHLGSGLRVNDAAFLNGLLGPKNPQQQADLARLADTVKQARATLASSLNGDAGNAAFQRYTSWLLPALQSGANLTDVTAGNRLQQFAPTAADYRSVTPSVGANDRLMQFARQSLSAPSLADLSRPGRDAINEGAGPIGEALIGAAAGGAGGLVRGAAAATRGVLADEGGELLPSARAAAMGVRPTTAEAAAAHVDPRLVSAVGKVARYGAATAVGSEVLQDKTLSADLFKGEK